MSTTTKRPPMPEMSEEQKKEQMIRAYLQKKAALAEGILFNMVQGCGGMFTLDDVKTDDLLRIVDIAGRMSTEFMRVVYNQEMKAENED